MSKLRNVLVCYPLYPPSLISRLKQHFDQVDYFPVRSGIDYSTKEPPQPPASALERADVLLAFHLPTNLRHVSQMPNLKLLQLVGSATHQVIDSDFVRSAHEAKDSQRFYVANSAGIHTSCIGEHVLMTTMMLFRKMNETIDFNRQQRWAAPEQISGGHPLYIRELRGSTVGVMGYGSLGREMGRLFSAFGCKVLACTRTGQKAAMDWLPIPNTGDPSGSIPAAWYSTSVQSSLYDFLSQCDVVVNCLPLSAATTNLLDAEALRRCRADTVIVNVGRGPTINTDALVDALKNKRIAGAALDVTDPEPLPDGHPLFDLPNVIITPHISWASPKNFERAIGVLLMNKERMEANDSVAPYNNIPY